MKVKNECRIDFNYKFSDDSPIITKTIFSNIVSTDIIKNILKVEKFVDKVKASVFSILTYTVVISNITKFNLNNVCFKDNIPKGTRFIKNSVIIDGVKKRCTNPDMGIYIGKINASSRIIISFKVIIVSKMFCENIKNYSIIDYDYIYNIEKPPTKIYIESNEVFTSIENKIFKPICVQDIIKSCNCIDTILDTKIKADIIKTKFINSINNDTKLGMCNMIIIGKIEYEILYTSNKQNSFMRKKKDKKHILKNVFGFSSFMLVPIGIMYENKESISLIIEDVSVNKINNNKIFLNANLLLHY